MAYQPKGLYFEDFELGKVYESQARTITESDVVNFAGLSGDFNALHMNEEFAKQGIFKKRIAHGALGVAIMTGMSNQMGIFDGTTVAFISLSVEYKAPLFIGDTVHLELDAFELKKSSKPGRGIVNFHANLINQEQKLITSSIWNIMMKSKN